jgi:hypothetical protein
MSIDYLMEEVVWLHYTDSHTGISSPSPSGTLLDVEKKVSGEIEIPNLSDEHEVEDVDVSWGLVGHWPRSQATQVWERG